MVINMKLNLSLKLKNIILIVAFVSICFMCDALFFEIVEELIFPVFSCNFKDTLGYHLYQASMNYRFLYNHICIVSCILGCFYFLFFRVYIFQKWVSIIENKCQGLFLHDFLKELRKNKQILICINVIFLLFTFEMYSIYSQYVRSYPLFAFIFFYPFHYLILYIRWAIKDKNIKNDQVLTQKYNIIHYANYFIFSNIFMIVFSYFFIFMGMLGKENFFEKLLCCALFLLIIFYIVYFAVYYIKYNIKLFIICFIIVFLLAMSLFCVLIYEIELINNILSFIFSTIYYSFIGIGIISSLFVKQLTKIVASEDINY